MSLLHNHFQLGQLFRFGVGGADLAGYIVVAADYLAARGVANHFVVFDALANHIHTHIGGRLVRRLANNLLQHLVQHREYLHITVVVHGNLSVSLKMIRVNHIDVLEIHRGGLIGQIHRMFERHAPHREGLELGITRFHPALVFVIELAQAGGHLAASGAGGGDHHQTAAGNHKLVPAIAIVAEDERDI